MNDSPTSSNDIPSALVLGVPFTCAPMDAVLGRMDNVITAREKHYISITNTESLYYATREPWHFDFVHAADLSCCDGVGVVIAGRMLGHRIPRIPGPDLMAAACRYGVERGWRHFFYGGQDGVPELLSEKLTEKYPGLVTAGCYSPPFRQLSDAEDAGIVAMINDSKADIVWVGLGLPKQERWIADHRAAIEAPWMSGVGAAFDFHAATIRRAPAFIRKIGMEWAFRLALEPRRMFVRNLRSVATMLAGMREAVGRKIRGPNAG